MFCIHLIFLILVIYKLDCIHLLFYHFEIENIQNDKITMK